MKQETFNQILTMMHTYGSRDCLKTIALQFPGVTYNTLVSIYSQDYQKKTRKNHHKHHKPDVMEKYYKRYLAGVAQDSGEPVLLRIAEEVDLSHYLLAKIVLERHLSHTCYEGQNPPRAVVSQMMKDPLSLIENKMLANEVQQCILNDPNYGPLMDNIKRSIGYEYELILRERLQNRGIPFLGEDDMRSRGYDKTPDCKLEIPIGQVMVRKRYFKGKEFYFESGKIDIVTPPLQTGRDISAVDGFVVNWIESKASFGDEYNHQTYLKDQFWSYWNRFGPGMVIYWFGFIDELDCNRERGIILRDDFPTDIVTLESLLETP